MDTNMVRDIILAVLGIVGGSGGILAFIVSFKKAKDAEKHDATDQWRVLFEDTLERLQKQEDTNHMLQSEINTLRAELTRINTELIGYKKYDGYITELESYTNSLQQVFKSLVSNEAYTSVVSSRPQRYISNMYDISSDKINNGSK